MAPTFPGECVSVLSRTPNMLQILLKDLPESWIDATEGPGTWSPYAVIGHLIHCEKADWMPRLRIILEHGPGRPFDPLDREAQFAELRRPLNILLDEFLTLRSANLLQLKALNLQPADLDRTGTHPAFGQVTLRQLLNTWIAHDLSHIIQISRILAKRLKPEVGPWAGYLSVMK
jgi:hypothetical protein